ncbi:hypothetical protein BDR04DRAFT_1138480 [Suillus decipiens]|nr:hypothetical protein BDR04DRAFT_1138480 [Suillus decipiens]
MINLRRISKRNSKSKRLRARQTLAILLLPKGDVVVLREARTRSQGEHLLLQQRQRLVLRGNAVDLRRRRRKKLLMANRLPNADAAVRPRQNQRQCPRQSQILHLMPLENQVQRKSEVGHRKRPEAPTFSVSVSLLCVFFPALTRICMCKIYRFAALSFTLDMISTSFLLL